MKDLQPPLPKVGDRILHKRTGAIATIRVVYPQNRQDEVPISIVWEYDVGPTGPAIPPVQTWHWWYGGRDETRFEILTSQTDEWEGELELL